MKKDAPIESKRSSVTPISPTSGKRKLKPLESSVSPPPRKISLQKHESIEKKVEPHKVKLEPIKTKLTISSGDNLH